MRVRLVLAIASHDAQCFRLAANGGLLVQFAEQHLAGETEAEQDESSDREHA